MARGRSAAWRRLRGSLLALGALATGATCRDSSPTGPGLPQAARLAIAPVFQQQAPQGGPRLTLARLRIRVHAHPSARDTIVGIATFTNDTARADVEVFVAGASQLFVVHLEGIGAAGDTLFRGSDTVRAFAGDDAEPASPALSYAGPDAGVTAIVLSPRDTTIDAPDSLRLGVSAVGAAPAAMYVGWTSRDPIALPVSDSGTVRPRSMERSAWVVARLYNGVTDSVLVHVRAPAASVLLPRDTATIVRGDSLQLTAEARDSAGTVLAGRAVAWTALDPTITVDGAGMVRALTARATGRVVATVGARSDTATITVAPRPVASVTIAPRAPALAPGDSFQLAAQALDAGQQANADHPVTWVSRTPAIATVSGAGMLRAIAAGNAWVVATSGTASDSVLVAVSGTPDLLSRSAASPDTVSGGAMFEVSWTVANTGTGSAPATQALAGIRDSASGAFVTAAGAAVVALAPGDSARVTTVLAAPSVGRTPVRWQLLFAADCPVSGVVTADLAACVAGSGGAVAELGEANNVVQRALVVAPASGGILSVVVTPGLDTLVALGDTLQLAAEAMGADGPVAGTFAWTSRAPAIASVSATGAVAALANGEAWIVAAESGGASDSALVVVRQRVTTVSVTPNAVTRYLGRTQQLSASAVDARGNAVSFATFAWSSTAPAIASVDSTGTVTMAGLGTAVVRATAGGITGQADVTVLTPISRIDVSPDSVTLGAFATAQGYTAVAYDTIGQPMSGVAFTWASSNPSVAPLSGTTSNATSATAVANGITRVQASAQGVTGSALLTVRQVLSAIEVTPGSSTIAPGGRGVLTARGRDPNGYYLTTNPAFAWASTAPGVATVDGSGVVAGVAQGATTITASSGQVTGGASVLVSNTVPNPRVNFGRDTIRLGRGSSSQVPIYLDMPSQSMVIVSMAAEDTIAWFPQPVDTILAGQTTIDVALNTRNAGTTRLFVSGTGGYGGDTVYVTVQANVRFATTSLGMVATDQRSTQVLLSDPAPAGGAYVTYQYSVANVAQVSPEPAFVPAGQLAADVVVRGLASGSTVITPVAAGASGANTLSVSVQPSTLAWYYGNGPLNIGGGQYAATPNYISIPTALTYPLTVTLASSDTLLVRTQSQVVIPAGQTIAGFTVRAVASAGTVGTAAITATAPGFTTSPGYQVRVTRPRLAANGVIGMNTTSAPVAYNVSVQDSLGSAHPRIASLRVFARSSDTTIARVATDTLTIAADQYYVTTSVRPGGSGGSAWIHLTAANHLPDSVRIDVSAPSLGFYYGGTTTTRTLGVNQYDANVDYVAIPNAISMPVTVTLSSSDSLVGTTTRTVIIPAGSTIAPFTQFGHAPGLATITASAPGYGPVTYRLRVTSPHIAACCSTTVPMYRGTISGSVSSRDSLSGTHAVIAPVAVTWTSRNAGVASIDSATTTIAAGASSSNAQRIRPVAPGTAWIVAAGPNGWGADSFQVTVTPAALSMYYGPNGSVGARQLVVNGNYVAIPDPRTDTVVVSVAQRNPAVSRVSAQTIRIAPGSTIAAFGWEGVAPGTDTLVFTAPGYTETRFHVTVTPRRLEVTDLPAALTTTSPQQSVRAFTRDGSSSVLAVADTVGVRITSTNPGVLQVDTVVRILRGESYTPSVPVRVVGAGTARVVAADTSGAMAPDTSSAVTVTGPSLGFYYGSNITTGMRQRATTPDYVAIPNALATPLTITLTSSDPRVAVPTPTVTIPAGTTIAAFDVTGGDTVGTVQVTATAPGYALATTTVQVGAPRLVLSIPTTATTTSPPGTIVVYLRDHAGNAREAADDFTITLVSTQPGVAAPDSASVRFTPGMSSNSRARLRYAGQGTASVAAGDPRPARYAYRPDTSSVTVSLPRASFYYSAPGATIPLGVGQLWTGDYVAIPNALPQSLSVSFAHDGRRATIAPSPAVIDAGQSLRAISAQALTAGVDTIVVSAPGHASSTYYLAITNGRIALNGWPGTLAAGDSVALRIYSSDAAGNHRPLAAATAFTLAPNANVELRDGQGRTISEVSIAAGETATPQFWVHGVRSGTGTVSISAPGFDTAGFNTAIP